MPAVAPTHGMPSGPAHKFDFPSLILDHKSWSKKTIVLVDLDVHVYGLEEIKDSNLPIGVILLSHGRCNNAQNMEPMASGLLGEIKRYEQSSGRRKTRDVLVVCTDARNHGTRTKDRNRNLSFDINPVHLIDMIATIYGVQQDHNLIMQFLASYLFPHDEREIVEWMPAGISMGGHTVWRMLREDPRIRIGVPIVTIPSETLSAHFEGRGIEYKVDPFYYPAGTRSYLAKTEPGNVYANKKILSLHGAIDWALPPKRGLPVLEKMVADAVTPGDVEYELEEGYGHKCSPNMVRRTAEWCWRWGLSEAA